MRYLRRSRSSPVFSVFYDQSTRKSPEEIKQSRLVGRQWTVSLVFEAEFASNQRRSPSTSRGMLGRQREIGRQEGKIGNPPYRMIWQVGNRHIALPNLFKLLFSMRIQGPAILSTLNLTTFVISVDDKDSILFSSRIQH